MGIGRINREEIKKGLHKLERITFRWLAHNKTLDNAVIWLAEKWKILIHILVAVFFLGIMLFYSQDLLKFGKLEESYEALIIKNDELAKNNNSLMVRKDELLKKIEVLAQDAKTLTFIQGCKKYKKHIRIASNEFKVDKHLVNSIIYCESRFRPFAKSRAGAIGMMQLMPQTVATSCRSIFIIGDEFDADLAWHPLFNIRAGTKYIKGKLNEYGNIDKALAAYNCGSGNLKKAIRLGGEDNYIKYLPNETRQYIIKVKKYRAVSKEYFD